MKRILPALFAIAAIVAVASPAAAADYSRDDLTIQDPWARASAGAAANGAAYMVITTAGDMSDQLIGAASPVAAKAELHTHIKEGDIMRMRPVAEIDVAAGKATVLQPGGLHVMLIGLKAPLKEGTTFPLTLTFKRAGSMTVDVDVRAPGAGAIKDMGHDMGTHHH